MINDQRTARDRDTRLENFAAELTGAVYALMLRRGLKDSWVRVELALWRALTETVEKWVRKLPPVKSPDAFEAWREGFLADVTERALAISLDTGIEGALPELQLGLSRAFGRVLGGRSRIPLRE